MSATDIIFDPAVPVWALLALCAAALAVSVFSAVKRSPGAPFRALAFAALIALIARPALRDAEREALPDIVAVGVDRSPSQQLGARAAQTDAALAALQERLSRLENIETRLFEVARAPDGTRLFEGLEAALADAPRGQLGGVVLLTDGQAVDAPDAESAPDYGAPLHVLLAGTAREGDRKLTILQAPRYGIVDEEMAITLRIDDFGATGHVGETVEAVVRIDGREAARGAVPLGRERTLRARVAHGGPNIVEVDVASAPNELTLANNTATLSVNGVRDRLRVLLVSGEPHPGERAWRNLLKSDPAVDLVHFTILRPPDKQDGTPTNELALIAFPTRELFQEKLSEFDLIIFDRYRLRGVLPPQYFYNIETFVENGGAVLVAAGPAFTQPYYSLARTPLANFLPAYPTGRMVERTFRPEVTQAGFRHPVTAGLPQANAGAEAAEWGSWFRMISARAIGGDVVMSGVDDEPLLVLDRYGEGRVAILLSDQAWLWSRGFEGGGPQAELFRRMAHWLMKEPDLEEEDLRATIRDGQLEIRRRTMADAPTPVMVTPPQGEPFELPLTETAPGLWTASASVETPGLYRAASGDLYAIAALGAALSRELQDVIATPELLAPTAAASGGLIAPLDSDGRLAMPRLRRVRADAATVSSATPRDGWMGLLQRNQYVLRNSVERPLAPPWLWLALAGGFLLVGWARESR